MLSKPMLLFSFCKLDVSPDYSEYFGLLSLPEIYKYARAIIILRYARAGFKAPRNNNEINSKLIGYNIFFRFNFELLFRERKKKRTRFCNFYNVFKVTFNSPKKVSRKMFERPLGRRANFRIAGRKKKLADAQLCAHMQNLCHFTG